VKQFFPALFWSAALFAALEAAVFHSGLYAYVVAPDSTTGRMETVLDNELARPRESRNQILGVGDSRMALVPRVANTLTSETGYTFATIATAGSTPRCWYYMLRAVDPHADRYRAIVIGIETFDDQEVIEPYADRESDLNYLAARLRLGDLWEFSRSYDDPWRRWRAARGILLKGLVYKRDFQDLLLHPLARWRYVRQSRRDSYRWFYDFVGDSRNLAGLAVDWERRAVTPPPGTDPGVAAALKRTLVDPLPPDIGRYSAYLHYWLGRIRDHYRGSATRLVFVRLARAPWIRPDLPGRNPRSSVRELDAEPNVDLLREDFSNPLERPELFRDEIHLNQPGLDRFSEMLAREMRALLGPPL
jgi:hypothetical protein